MKKKISQAWCRRCKNITFHEEIATATWTPDEYFVYQEQYSLIRCRGCECVSFKLSVYDEENVERDEYGIETLPAANSIYPEDRLIAEPIDSSIIPPTVKEIYTETINCINRKDFILGAAGCRAVIEAICNEQNIAGRDLKTKINNLFRSHLITAKDKDHLHAIRFMGNDSIHISCKYSQYELKIVAHIINSILTSLYIITEESKQLKEHPIDNFNDFLSVLNKILDNTNDGEEKTLKQLTSNHRIIMEDYLSEFEPILIAKIEGGEFTRLSLINGSSPQKYKVEN